MREAEPMALVKRPADVLLNTAFAWLRKMKFGERFCSTIQPDCDPCPCRDAIEVSLGALFAVAVGAVVPDVSTAPGADGSVEAEWHGPDYDVELHVRVTQPVWTQKMLNKVNAEAEALANVFERFE